MKALPYHLTYFVGIFVVLLLACAGVLASLTVERIGWVKRPGDSDYRIDYRIWDYSWNCEGVKARVEKSRKRLAERARKEYKSN